MDVDTKDLFVSKEESLTSVEDEFGPSFFILLRNFELNGSQLRPDNVDILRDRVVPYIQRPIGVAEIYAMTDRSGSRQVNYQVSGQRLISTQQSLRGFGAPLEKVQHGFPKAVGEDFFAPSRSHRRRSVYRRGCSEARRSQTCSPSAASTFKCPADRLTPCRT